MMTTKSRDTPLPLHHQQQHPPSETNRHGHGRQHEQNLLSSPSGGVDRVNSFKLEEAEEAVLRRIEATMTTPTPAPAPANLSQHRRGGSASGPVRGGRRSSNFWGRQPSLQNLNLLDAPNLEKAMDALMWTSSEQPTTAHLQQQQPQQQAHSIRRSLAIHKASSRLMADTTNHDSSHHSSTKVRDDPVSIMATSLYRNKTSPGERAPLLFRREDTSKSYMTEDDEGEDSDGEAHFASLAHGEDHERKGWVPNFHLFSRTWQWLFSNLWIRPVKSLWRYLWRSTWILSLPAFVTGWIVYHNFGAPVWVFIMGNDDQSNVTLNWWLTFFGKQCIMFEVARLGQWILIDWFVLSSGICSIGPRLLGPSMVLLIAQAKGLPCVVLLWAILDVSCFYGNTPFKRHWFYWVDNENLSFVNDTSGDWILSTEIYTRWIYCLFIYGVAGIVKNTLLTTYFGKRNLESYRPQLEDILNQIIVVSEIASLAEGASTLSEEQSTNISSPAESFRAASDTITSRKWSLKDDGSYPSGTNGRQQNWQSVQFSRPLSCKAGGMGVPFSDHDATGPETKSVIKNNLDRWLEPLNKADHINEVSLEDIYMFRKALKYMDMVHPFSEAFGPASNRDECIESAESVYRNLLKLSPNQQRDQLLDFSLLTVLNEENSSVLDKDQTRAMKHLFRPDCNNKVTLVAFVQGCDTVYKRLRYFRAGVGNASILDSVLEGIINIFFNICFVLVALHILKFDPWHLLVPLSTLLLTFAFAVGPSAAKMIEGIIVIVVKRPYDIGDRIVISHSPGENVVDPEEAANSWFVEDIALFTTILRYAPSNEIAVVSNGSLASARIVNCAKSKNVKVNLELKFHLRFHEGDNVQKFVEGLRSFVSDHPQAWKDIHFFHCREIDAAGEFVKYVLRMQSRRSWQSAVPVLADRSELLLYCSRLAKKLNVQFKAPQERRIMYMGGALEDGAIKTYKSNLLDRDNLIHFDQTSFNISSKNLMHCEAQRNDLPINKRE